MPSKNNIAVSSGAFNPHGLDDKPLVEAATSFNHMEEIWKDVKGYEGNYQISNYGNVKSLERSFKFGISSVNNVKEMFLKHNIANDGYPNVTLCKNGKVLRFRISRLVALHFIENPLNKPFVCHKDDNILNNYYENLYWGTPKENSHDALLKGRLRVGANHPMAILTVEQVKEIKKKLLLYKYGDGKKIAKEYNVTPQTISYIKNNKQWKLI